LAKARPGSILIFHDGFDARGEHRTNTVAAVRIVITALARRGYRFVTVDDLLGIPGYHVAEGHPERDERGHGSPRLRSTP
jgi:peptidoglycan/xylan/chitin deacetylase (PgdA/CDA1 family)